MKLDIYYLPTYKSIVTVRIQNRFGFSRKNIRLAEILHQLLTPITNVGLIFDRNNSFDIILLIVALKTPNI